MLNVYQSKLEGNGIAYSISVFYKKINIDGENEWWSTMIAVLLVISMYKTKAKHIAFTIDKSP